MKRAVVQQKQQFGLSSWVIFPWLLCLAMAAILWLIYPQLTTKSSLVQTPVANIENQPAPVESSQQSVVASPVTPAPSSYHQAVQTAAQSVVNIYTTQQLTQHPYANDPAFRLFMERYYGGLPQEQGNNLGSGVIVSKDGYIVTNAHVIDKASEITVALQDGRKAPAKLIGSDVDSDLAVIKVEMSDLVPMKFRTEPIRIGDVTLAIGNPFGVGQTVTQGIISATGRAGLGLSRFEDFIQTDAAINPGNSGGALVDADGALIGVNTAIYSRSGGSMGIGFAIPTAIVEQVMKDLIEHGKVSRGWLGIEIAENGGKPTDLNEQQGLLITRVLPNSPASQAGIQAGDVLLSIDGVALNAGSMLVNAVAKKSPGTALSVELDRQGQKLQVSVVLAQRPTQEQAQTGNQAQIQELLEQIERLQNR